MCQRKQYDVIVAGGGPSGVAAAVAAARNGCKTLLIERGSCLGGMATQALVPAFGPFTNAEVDLIGGIGREILEKLKKDGYKSPFYDRKPDRIEGIDWHQIDSEMLKCVLDEILVESQCDILFHTDVVEVEKLDRMVRAVCIYYKGKKEWIDTKYLIDCTGNADLAEMAGVGFDYGDEEGNVQAGTLCFRVAGIDVPRFMDYVRSTGEDGNLSKACGRAIRNGEFPEGEMKVGGMALQADGVAGLNFGHSYNLSPLDPWKLSWSEIEARKKLPELIAFLRKYVPGMENCVLVSSGIGIGIRESRRIHGRYTLTGEDYFKRADFEDAIAYYSYPVDLHPAAPGEGAEMELNYQKWRYENGECYGIPYWCLIPDSLDNLAVAGKTISADRIMMASIRMMPPCFATGQAAGTACAIGVTEDFQTIEVLSLTAPDNRNMVLFPEKIDGKYMRLERPFPVYSRGGIDRFDIWMSASPDLKYWGETKLLMGVEDVPYANDKIGPGAPPVKTDAGWLTLFHAVDIDRTRGKNGWETCWQKRYCAGIMLLDLKDPSKIIGMYKEPLIAPETEYEVEGGFRTNVIFPGGLILENDRTVKIYYGASDTVECLATARVEDLIQLCKPVDI